VTARGKAALAVGAVLDLPMAVQEMVLPLCLIVKGFAPSPSLPP
jgi:hypothetical protein